MNEIKRKKSLAPGVTLLEIEAPLIADKARPGNFLILRVNEKGERIPLTIADYDRQAGTITIIFQEVGYTTKLLGSLNEGESLMDVAGPLGSHLEIKGYEKVVCVGGGSGVALLYPEVKAFSRQDSEVITITGARTRNLVILEEELRELSERLYVCTDDGSLGHEGFVTDVLQDILNEEQDIDLVVAIGPVVMMQAVAEMTEKKRIKTIVSLNSLMVDGTGMCGGCRVTVDGEVKFTCIDGPSFDAHKVDFDELSNRLSYYRDYEEMLADEDYKAGDSDE